MAEQAVASTSTLIGGVRVLELGEELVEYCGRLLSGLGADVLKVEPPGGAPTRSYGPFLDDDPDQAKSLYFWHYNLGKRSICLDLETVEGKELIRALLRDADVFLTSWSPERLESCGLGAQVLSDDNAGLVYARISPFGDSGPWSGFKGSDLVHMALGGVAMNCGYDPDPFGVYDTPPIAPQMWLSYAITGEMTAFAIMGALHHRASGGRGQLVMSAVHDAVSKNTENDLPNWVYLSIEHLRQTCRHSNPTLSPPTICESKDGRWHMPYRTYMTSAMKNDVPNTARLLEKYGMQADLGDSRYEDPEFVKSPDVNSHVNHVVADFFARIRAEHEIWVEAQGVGLPWAPVRRPEENVGDAHWKARDTFIEVYDPTSGRRVTDVGQKWVSTIPWHRPERVPVFGDGQDGWLPRERTLEQRAAARVPHDRGLGQRGRSWRGKPFALADVRIIDFSWLLASGGAGRFLASLGAEVVKVEHHTRPDHMRNSWVGRVPDPAADEPGHAERALNRSGSFMEVNAGKLSASLDLKQETGLELVYDLVRNSDAVISGFSPGTMDRLGLGYAKLKELNPAIVMVEQSAVGSHGAYGAIRGYGPTAQAMSGLSDMSGLAEPFPPAGIGYSFLDWYGAYNMANAVMAGLLHARLTGEGCHIDASQVEAGIFLTGTAIIDHSANGRRWNRYGNRSPYKVGAPHGIYRAKGDDRWIAISCFDDSEWCATAQVLEHPEWIEDVRFASLDARIRHQDQLDAIVDAATRAHDAYDLMTVLQRAGVAAGPAQTARDRFEVDPQLSHGGWLVDLQQSDIGTWPVKESPFTMSLTPPAMGGMLHRHGPSYGEDSTDVLTRIVGLTQAQISELRERGVVGR